MNASRASAPVPPKSAHGANPCLRSRPGRRPVWLAAAVWLGGCAVGPDYVRVPVEVPPAYGETGPWKTAQPQPIDALHPWWQLYGDPTLDALIDSANGANLNIRQAEAQYREARALEAQARSALFPSVSLSAGVSRGRSDTTGIRTADAFGTGLGANWVPDFWGGVRRAVEAGHAGTEASADDLAAARLSIQSSVAQDYLSLRVVDVQRDLYASSAEAYARALKLTQSQYAAGVALRSDVALAQSQLKTTQAAGVDLEASRAQLVHAIAVLLGKPPATFSLPPVKQTLAELQAHLPVIPTGLPSAILERRPDIAGAERRVAVANANIGVARAAFYPSVTLSASGGFNAATFAPLFDVPSRIWSLGATLAQTVFDGGLRGARSDQAVAAYDVSVAQYKETVLVGFQQVEDNLATLRVLDQESQLLADAVQSSQLAERSVLAQYRAGTVNYLSVVTAQTLSLTNQRSVTQVVGRQLAASVSLVTAIGGGWDANDPSAAGASPPATPLAAADPAPRPSAGQPLPSPP